MNEYICLNVFDSLHRDLAFHLNDSNSAFFSPSMTDDGTLFLLHTNMHENRVSPRVQFPIISLSDYVINTIFL